MRKLDISYSELLDRIAQKGLGLPRVSREEAKRMGHLMDKILDRAGVAMTTDWRALHGSLKGKGNGKRLSIEEINGAAAMTDDETLTHEEAAALVGGYPTLAHRVAVGDLPRLPDGKFRRGDVEALRDRLAKHPAHPWGLEAALRQVRATGSMGFSPREAGLEDLIADGEPSRPSWPRGCRGFSSPTRRGSQRCCVICRSDPRGCAWSGFSRPTTP